jgi:hypothetical protein
MEELRRALPVDFGVLDKFVMMGYFRDYTRIDPVSHGFPRDPDGILDRFG